jgi:hypothetical protein
MRRLRNFLRDERGATLVETTIVFPLVLILTFGLVEFGNAFWQYHTAEKATAAGARWLSTRHGVAGAAALTNELYTTVVPDCFVNSADPLGTACGQVAGATGWSQTCGGGGGGACDAAVMAGLLAQMQQFAPFITDANINVQLRGSAMGFVGRGRAIPLITVRTTGLTYNFVTLNSLLGFGPITMPSFASTYVAEDQKEGPGI